MLLSMRRSLLALCAVMRCGLLLVSRFIGKLDQVRLLDALLGVDAPRIQNVPLVRTKG